MKKKIIDITAYVPGYLVIGSLESMLYRILLTAPVAQHRYGRLLGSLPSSYVVISIQSLDIYHDRHLCLSCRYAWFCKGSDY